MGNNGKVFNTKMKAKAMELQIEASGNMTVKDNLLPIDGVTVYEEIGGGSSSIGNRALNDKTASNNEASGRGSIAKDGRNRHSCYTVSKRGKPYTKLNPNE